MRRAIALVPAIFACILGFACGSNGKQSTIDDGTANGTGNGNRSGNDGGSGNHANGGSGLIVLDGGGASGNATHGGAGNFDPDAACVTSSANGEPVPVDLYFMVDISGSMNCPVPDTTGCEVDPGGPYAATTRWTVESTALKDFLGAPANAGLGVGIAFFPSGSNICDVRNYARPAVEIAALPAPAAALNTAINAQHPTGNTPTVASLTGAIQHATTWATAHAGHRVGVVYLTDGYPRGCTGDITDAASVAQAAFEADPSIRTYVLGVGPNLSSLNQIAASGGTDQAYFIDTARDASAQFAAALASIRNNALLGCTYTIPRPPAGQELDYGKVNVRYTSGGGDVTDVARDPSATECVQGWQYSADKTQINLCGDLCESVKADTGGSVQILFGCSTVVNPPR